MLKRRRTPNLHRPEQLVDSGDQLVERYETIAEVARPAFARHQRLLLEECIRQNGLAPAQMQILMDEIANGLERVDEFEEALVIRRRHAEFAIEHLGDEDPASLAAMQNLGNVLYWVEQYDASIELFERVWAILCRDLGKRDDRSLELQRDLATALVRAGRVDRAIELDEDLLENYRDTLGAEHEQTVIAAQQLEVAKQWAAKGPEQAAT